ncbi:predicted protein [Sclerotinia sclerotiorum 1980 UF-70]|uniref:Uncharacterized protein n=2 Tax=Sclerotinia sclerotiorum (strain ATCC 18683 / 1980 / Ss-1) TaxID=665079 RepID=A7E5F9_SCLS1|nr:predicted protein [Sclerotinia sclerotiorum 1980 UF-70]APA07861.1 hypothetical protein sscle_03g026310 [Sclerotinia sclerotiorum 1980 UF-70]EDN91131.1 predicted protein [Sclerotinia sclerotiorum 1980 UF-70]
MAKLQTLVAAMIFSGAALATPQGGPIQGLTSCFTYTTTVPYTKPHSCPLQTICPVHPHCLVLEVNTITVPAPNKLCPTTPTVTATGPITCPPCQKGCITRLETVTTTLAA